MAAARNPQRGFTLAELAVATTILTIVMTAVYSSFGTALREWRRGEYHMQAYQDVRVAMSVMSRELGCIVGGSEHLFQGKDDEIEFYTVSQPMHPATLKNKGDGARILQVKYRLNPTGHNLVRQEATVEKPLPLAPAEGEEVDRGRIDVKHKAKIDLTPPKDTGGKIKDKDKDTSGYVAKLKFTYYWVPPDPPDQNKDEPPVWVDPIEMTENREGWGLPQAVRIEVTVSDANSKGGHETFSLRHTFRGPTTPYDEKKIGAIPGGEK